MPLLLVVEDNEMNADMLMRRLNRKGFETAWAVNGVQALEMVEELKPALILMDLSLPEMDGYQAARIIKSGPRRNTPIIALTAHALLEDQQKALSAGCDDYETKPINFPQLLAKIYAQVGEPHEH
ncbi:MAG: response regulator [Pseudomonas sp.]|uniref:response regulator n=1 Tax=Pseudomonas sp. TaxID=306 RepID=UPI003BB6E181